MASVDVVNVRKAYGGVDGGFGTWPEPPAAEGLRSGGGVDDGAGL